jgi:hypothetical protein
VNGDTSTDHITSHNPTIPPSALRPHVRLLLCALLLSTQAFPPDSFTLHPTHPGRDSRVLNYGARIFISCKLLASTPRLFDGTDPRPQNKLKVQLKLSISRLRMVQQKDSAKAKQQRREMAQLLEVQALNSPGTATILITNPRIYLRACLGHLYRNHTY